MYETVHQIILTFIVRPIILLDFFDANIWRNKIFTICGKNGISVMFCIAYSLNIEGMRLLCNIFFYIHPPFYYTCYCCWVMCFKPTLIR